MLLIDWIRLELNSKRKKNDRRILKILTLYIPFPFSLYRFREEVNHKNTEDDDQIKLILEAKQRRLNTDLEAFYQKYLNDT